MTDNLITCPHCGGNACYEKQINISLKTYLCYGCGFQSNTLMKEGEEFYDEQIKSLPELYKDLIFEDKNGLRWMPSYIDIQGKGTVFIKGTSIQDWKWSAMKHRKIEDNEKEMFKNPKGGYYKFASDTKTLKAFEKHDFIEGLDYIGVFEKDNNED
jgi:hypothetical protein